MPRSYGYGSINKVVKVFRKGHFHSTEIRYSDDPVRELMTNPSVENEANHTSRELNCDPVGKLCDGRLHYRS